MGKTGIARAVPGLQVALPEGCACLPPRACSQPLVYIVLSLLSFASSFPPISFSFLDGFFSMQASYPIDCNTCMNLEGPSDPRFRVPGGCLQYHPMRDSRFPYLYSLPTHALIHSPQYIKKILIHIVDTSCKACIKRAKFDHTLSVPLGPDALMKEYGT